MLLHLKPFKFKTGFEKTQNNQFFDTRFQKIARLELASLHQKPTINQDVTGSL